MAIDPTILREGAHPDPSNDLGFAIIAGANKCGTTSLFRYLADHPSVCPSRVKETDFFLAEPTAKGDELLAQYRQVFRAPTAATTTFLEASPSYLMGGGPVADRLLRCLGRPKLILMLREPASRLLSYWRTNRQNLYKDDVAKLPIPRYVELVEAAASGTEPKEPGVARNAWLQFQRGYYAPKISEYLIRFPPEAIFICSFDELRDDSRHLCVRLATWLEVDPGFYTNYTFTVENRTREHRFRRLQKLAHRFNQRFEPWLVERPALKRTLRSLYERLNEQRTSFTAGAGSSIAPELIERLTAVYDTPNAELRHLLSTRFPSLKLPPWLNH
ncbi:sulfotransferase domain-containing protein [Halochromatium glycolicum]|jgi:hypothetical protein|uniref:Sulfotransferase domain-containing protein n=1 Tax=Halochromatium glycolicum TaxID=85075 RepID=A0AAJ0U6U9_9GAMM|nr:sulfotransferase domain-containing protein [Halochromatium glycolicum]MBK1706374.1 hypothetical protein [Halochromatium glycolicum]